MKKEEAINDFYQKLASQVNFKKAGDNDIPITEAGVDRGVSGTPVILPYTEEIEEKNNELVGGSNDFDETAHPSEIYNGQGEVFLVLDFGDGIRKFEYILYNSIVYEHFSPSGELEPIPGFTPKEILDYYRG